MSPPNISPLMGDDRSAPPGTSSWYVARVGENSPRYDHAMPSVVPGAPRTIATSWTMRSEPRSALPKPNAPTVNTAMSVGMVTHAHSRRSSQRRTR